MTDAMVAPGRLERRKARTRAAIIESAAALFHERGFEETSIQQIAERADTGVGTLYGYFASKDEILREVLHLARNEALERYLAAIDETTPWIDRLCTALAELVAYFRENRTMLIAAFHVAPREVTRMDGREAVWLYNAYLSILEEGMAAGEFRHLPADATVRLLINTYTMAALGIGPWAGRSDDPRLMAELDELVRGLVLRP